MSRVRRLVLAVIATAIITAPLAFPQAAQFVPGSAVDEVTLRIIVVSSADEGQRVVQRLSSGENFIVLAKQVSIDATADSGGLLGRIARSALRPELRRALEGLPVGRITPVVRIPTGFAVLQIVPDADAGEITTAGSTVSPAVAATGSVRYVLMVAGLSESLTAVGQFPKPTDWNQDPRVICDLRTRSLAAAQDALERDLSPGNATTGSAPPLELLQA
jgi:PPIC-type PPIASE domain